jgi:hypothetical protein
MASPFTNPDIDPSEDAPMEQARVVYNVLLDYEEIGTRQSANAEPPLYPKFRDEYDNSVFRREICFSYNPKYKNTSSSKKTVSVFSSLNGAFRQSDTPLSLYDKVKYAGIAGIDCKYDERSEKNSRSGLPVAKHGTDQISNTGPFRIMAGDIVIFGFPSPDTKGNVPTLRGRLVAQTLPFRPHDPKDKNHALLAETMHELISARHQPRVYDYENHDRSRTEDAAIGLRKSLLQAAAVILNVALEAGIVKVNPDYLTEIGFDDENLDYTDDIKEQFLSKFLKNTDVAEQFEEFPYVAKNGRTTSLDDEIDSALFSRDRETRIYPDHVVAQATESQKEISRAQNSCVEFLLKGIEAMNHHFKDRKLGRAMTTADPGEKFRIMLDTD